MKLFNIFSIFALQFYLADQNRSSITAMPRKKQEYLNGYFTIQHQKLIKYKSVIHKISN